MRGVASGSRRQRRWSWAVIVLATVGGLRWANADRSAGDPWTAGVAAGNQAAAAPAGAVAPDRRDAGRAILERWRQAARPDWIDIAFYYVMLDDHNAALDALERGLAERAPMMSAVRVAPFWDPLRNDPRFERIIRAMR